MIQCPRLTTAIDFEPSWLRPCCEPMIKMPQFPYEGGSFNLENYISFLNNTLKTLQNDSAEICSGCPVKVKIEPPMMYKATPESHMPSLALPIRLQQILINHFRDLCNCKCCYCWNWRRPRKVGLYSVKNILKYFYDAGMIANNASYSWGGGEVTLLPEFEELSQWIADQGNNKQTILTNGILFSSAITCLLERDAVNIIDISLDSGSPEGYKRIKGVDKFYDVIENIKQYMKQAKRPSIISLKFIILEREDNRNEIEPFFELCKTLDIVNIRYSVDMGIDHTNVKQRTLESVMLFESIAKSYNMHCRPVMLTSGMAEKIENYRKLHITPGMYSSTYIASDYPSADNASIPVLGLADLDNRQGVVNLEAKHQTKLPKQKAKYVNRLFWRITAPLRALGKFFKI